MEREWCSGKPLVLSENMFIISIYLLQPHTWPGNDWHFCTRTSGLHHCICGSGCFHGVPLKEQCTSGAPTVQYHLITRNLVLAGELRFLADKPSATYLSFLIDEAFGFSTPLLWAAERWCSWSSLAVLVKNTVRVAAEEVDAVFLHDESTYHVCHQLLLGQLMVWWIKAQKNICKINNRTLMERQLYDGKRNKSCGMSEVKTLWSLELCGQCGANKMAQWWTVLDAFGEDKGFVFSITSTPRV